MPPASTSAPPIAPIIQSMTKSSPVILTSISPLLKKLSQAPHTVTPEEVNAAISQLFSNSLSPVQATAFLTSLHFTKLDENPGNIAAAARGMRKAGVKITGLEPRFVSLPNQRLPGSAGAYNGGLVDIAGTGGDGHDTFNVSTTAAILATSCGLQVCKHGNKASTSTSGSADVLAALGADLTAINADKVRDIFLHQAAAARGKKVHSSTLVPCCPPQTTGTFCFVFAPVFHPSVKHVAPIRSSLPFRTIFNFLGPLVNPIDYSLPGGLEARVIGVGNPCFGRIFADTLVLLGVTRALIVCGTESLDEISPAVETYAWKVRRSRPGERISCNGNSSSSNSSSSGGGGAVVEEFKLHPTKTFGLRTHSLSRVAGGKSPQENAAIMKRLLRGEIDPDSNADTDERAILDFVIANTAAMLVVAGVTDTRPGETWLDEENVDAGVVVGGRWIDAVNLVKKGIRSGKAWLAWQEFADWTRASPPKGH